MRACIAARETNRRITIVVTAANDGEHAWLQEFGATHICGAQYEHAEWLLRSLRRLL